MWNFFLNFQERTENIFTKVILVVLYVLTFLSLIVVLVLFVESISEIINNGICVSSDCIKRFIDYFIPFKDILGSTIIIIGLFLVIRQVQIMSTANKISNWIDWRDNLEKILKSEIGSRHSRMYRYFEVNGREIHDYLFNTNMFIRNKEHLKGFFKNFIAEKIAMFEQNTTEYKNDKLTSCLYENITSYSYFGYFNKISEYIFRPSIDYEGISEDVKDLYFKKVDKYKKEIIKSSQLSKKEKNIES